MTDIHQAWVDDGPLFSPPKLAARNYNRAFPDRPPLSYGGKHPMVTGCWMIGSCYQNPNPLYGAYPYGYLERVHAMFPDARRILHAFSGGLGWWEAAKHHPAITINEGEYCEQFDMVMGPDADCDPDVGLELVDMHGPDQGRYPTWQGDVLTMPEDWHGRFDLLLADPPYSADDAAKYDCPPPNRRKIMRALRKVAAPGANLVFLDQCWPQHRKDEWKTWGTIGLIRSTNHRMRLVSIFQAV